VTGDPTAVETRRYVRAVGRHRVIWFIAALALLAGVCVASVAVGSALLPPSTVWDALTSYNGSIDHITVRDVRVPRTAIGVMVGAGLGVAGALMQAVSRNPLADPGILGVNAGAGLAVALGVAYLGLTQISEFIWLALLGSVIAAVLVTAIAARGPGGVTPLRLTLVGVAMTAVFNGMSMSLSLVNPARFEHVRFWGVGTIADRPPGTAGFIAPFVIAGLALAVIGSRSLNALALGDDVARGVGVRVRTTQVMGLVSLVLLCGAATAAAGPIAFVGLMIPHAVRLVAGVDQRWVILYSAVAGPILLLSADIVGRLVLWPAELQVGVITPLIGAPILIWLVRRKAVR